MKPEGILKRKISTSKDGKRINESSFNNKGNTLMKLHCKPELVFSAKVRKRKNMLLPNWRGDCVGEALSIIAPE